VLLGPVERQIELAQTRRGEFTGLPPLQDRLDQLRAQEGKANQTPDVAPGDVVTLGQFLERSGTTGGELLKPHAPAGDRPDQRRITSRSVDVLRQSGQHQLGFSTAPLEGDCRRQFDSIVTSVLRCGCRDTPVQQWPAPKLDGERLVIDHDFLDKPSHELCSFPEWVAERYCETSRPTEHFPNLITGHAGCIKPLDQLRRARQAFDQNSDHGFFDLPGTEPLALCAIGSGLSDQRGGDVVAIAPAFLDGV